MALLQQAEKLVQLKKEINEWRSKYNTAAEWEKKYQELSKTLLEQRTEYDNLRGVLEQKEYDLVELAKLFEKQKELTVDANKETILVADKLGLENKTLRNHRNIFTGLFGVLGLGILSYAARRLWVRRGKKAVDKVQDVIQGGAERVIGEEYAKDLREKMEKLETHIVQTIDERLPKSVPPPLPVKQDPDPAVAPPPPEMHPDYRQPPAPIVMPRANVPVYYVPVDGLGPVPPEMPGQIVSTVDVLNAVDEVAKRHPKDDRLSVVPQLVRQILNEPRRI
jgi:hypothetical protein